MATNEEDDAKTLSLLRAQFEYARDHIEGKKNPDDSGMLS
jgi:hypothetical protein